MVESAKVVMPISFYMTQSQCHCGEQILVQAPGGQICQVFTADECAVSVQITQPLMSDGAGNSLAVLGRNPSISQSESRRKGLRAVVCLVDDDRCKSGESCWGCRLIEGVCSRYRLFDADDRLDEVLVFATG